MTEEQKIRRRTPTVAEQERLRKAMTEESRPEAMDANRELGRRMLAQKREAAAATAAVLKKRNASNCPSPIWKPKPVLVAVIFPDSGTRVNPA